MIHPIGQKLTVGNDPAGLKRLQKSLAASEVALVVMEATGKFHREAHRNLSTGGFAAAIVNLCVRICLPRPSTPWPRPVPSTRACARCLCESLGPGITPPPSGLVETLQERGHGRDAAVTARTAILNQLGASKTKRLILELKRQLKAVGIAVANLDIEIKHLIAGDPVLARRLDILTRFPASDLSPRAR